MAERHEDKRRYVVAKAGLYLIRCTRSIGGGFSPKWGSSIWEATRFTLLGAKKWGTITNGDVYVVEEG